MARTLLPLLMLVSSPPGKAGKNIREVLCLRLQTFQMQLRQRGGRRVCVCVCAKFCKRSFFTKNSTSRDAVKHNLDPVNLFPSLSAVRNKFEFIFGFVPAIQSVKRLLSQRQWRRTQAGHQRSIRANEHCHPKGKSRDEQALLVGKRGQGGAAGST